MQQDTAMSMSSLEKKVFHSTINQVQKPEEHVAGFQKYTLPPSHNQAQTNKDLKIILIGPIKQENIIFVNQLSKTKKPSLHFGVEENKTPQIFWATSSLRSSKISEQKQKSKSGFMYLSKSIPHNTNSGNYINPRTPKEVTSFRFETEPEKNLKVRFEEVICYL